LSGQLVLSPRVIASSTGYTWEGRAWAARQQEVAMAGSGAVEVRFGAPGNVLEVQVGTVEIDGPRSVGYFGGLAAALGLGLIDPPLALFIAAVPVFKAMTNSALPRPVRVVGEVLEGAAKPVGSDADGVVQLEDQSQAATKKATVVAKTSTRRRTNRTRR
jgi:hypothetical protein